MVGNSLEELILHFLPNAFKGYKVQEKSVLRVTRNAEIDVTKVYDEDLNYRDQMAQVVKLRKKLALVRLELTRDIAPKMVDKVCEYPAISAGGCRRSKGGVHPNDVIPSGQEFQGGRGAG